MRPRSRNDFHIAIICALPIEGDAVETLFDEIYDRLSKHYGKQRGDNNAYVTGRIGQHNVVLCYLPGMGKRSAASATANLRVSYCYIQLALLVGICGGVPFPSSSKGTETILGDVIISDSVIEFDFGRQFPDGFRRKSDGKDTLGRPNQEIRAFLAGLNGRYTQSELQTQVYQHLQVLQVEPLWVYPGVQHDYLFEATYRHKHYQQGSDTPCICFSKDTVCDDGLKKDCHSLGCTGKPIKRIRHREGTPKPCIHIGKMASADTVMKSGEHRDNIAKREGVIGFEMEGAGMWDNMPCIIIKGVCDYADSHKNKQWQNYAAATAAATTKTLLEYWLPTGREDKSDEYLEEVTPKVHERNASTQVSPYLNIQRQMERQQPVFFVDALGKVAPFHLEFIRSAGALTAVLKANFRNYGPAADMIDKGEFVLFDIATNRDIDLRKHWDTVFRPGQAVAMSMVFSLEEAQKDNFCPNCKTISSESTLSAIQCSACGAVFRRIIDVTDSNEKTTKPRRILDGYSETTDFGSPRNPRIEELLAPSAQRPNLEQEDLNETISMFRNVRIISKPLPSRSRKVWCNIQAWVWYYNDHNCEKRAGWCYVENNDTVIVESHQEQGLALFVRRIGLKCDLFKWDTGTSLMWTEGSDTSPGDTGYWRFDFQSRKDLQIIWDYIQHSKDAQIASQTSHGDVNIYPDNQARPLAGTKSFESSMLAEELNFPGPSRLDVYEPDWKYTFNGLSDSGAMYISCRRRPTGEKRKSGNVKKKNSSHKSVSWLTKVFK